MAGNLSQAQDIYENLWRKATAAFDRGEARLDPLLKDRSADRRRGVTLIARPDGGVCSRIQKFLRRVAEVAPHQYFYAPAEFHLTVFSIIPGSEGWRQPAEQLPEYLAALKEVLKDRPAFSVVFRGATASPEAVMIQGFPIGNALAQLRDDLRATLHRRGLGSNLDRRYKIATAHLTVVRFSSAMTSWKPLKTLLEAHRHTDFGETHVRSLQLIESDWYASAQSVRTLHEYPLF